MWRITQIRYFFILLSFSNVIQLKAYAAEGILAEAIDPVVVQEKIQLLGLRDDTIRYSDEQPENWLKTRRLSILPELIAGLDNPEKRIAAGCLKIMVDVTDSEELYQVLVRIAADNSHPINQEAILALCGFPLDEKARIILQKALPDLQRFEDPRNRAKIALALGLKSQAVELIVGYIKSCGDVYDKQEAVKWLGEIGDPSAISLLEQIAESPEWQFAVEAYLAMAKIDPAKHELTEVQQAFLIDSRRQGKWTQEAQLEWWKELAKYDKNEVRPFVMQMLRTDFAKTALAVLQTWKDKEALPEIKRIIESNIPVQKRMVPMMGDMSVKNKRDTSLKRRDFPYFLIAYLDIEDTSQSIQDVASVLKASYVSRMPPLEFRFFVREIAESEMTRERKIEVLRGIRNAIGPFNLARGTEYLEVNDESASIILTLMQAEDDITALGGYTRAAIHQKHSTFAPEITRSLDLLVSKNVLGKEEDFAAQSILEACVVYNIQNAGMQVNRILESNLPLSVKLSAASVCTELEGNRNKGLSVLYHALKHENIAFRKQASEYLMEIPCRDEKERAEREDVLLSCFGQLCEDYSLRLLTTCAGPKSAEVLQKLLDEENVSRAVYAAWVLAQNPDEQVRQKGLRRVAIYAMFNHQMYQQGSGIDFQIAPDLSFHQVTGRLNPGTYNERPVPVTIPDHFLIPFTWDEKEQAFSIRAYRSILWKRYHSNPVDFLERYVWPQSNVDSLDNSLLPLLKVIAQEDPVLSLLYIKGIQVAYFRNRHMAAKVISKITGETATYPGLEGEAIDSAQTPEQPYENQNQQVAEFVLGQIKAANIEIEPKSDEDWNRREPLRYWIYDLIEKGGPELKEALFVEAKQRNMSEDLEKTRFSIWAQRN